MTTRRSLGPLLEPRRGAQRSPGAEGGEAAHPRNFMNPLYRTATFRYGHYRRSTAVEGFPSA
ncbi:hypothetical protein VB716_06105, partial [Synechococcus sp. CCY9201]|uniref:hypothetical protein n=1 Tax=Synechococcus sp. CCY9201 TaxID=174697 RepID=UPI002B1ED878